MISKDLLNLVTKKSREKNRVKVAKSFALGMGIAATVGATLGILFAPKLRNQTPEGLRRKAVDTVEDIKDTVQKKAETVKKSVSHVAEEVYHVIKDNQRKTEAVKKDIKDGSHEISKDLQEAAENISNELK